MKKEISTSIIDAIDARVAIQRMVKNGDGSKVSPCNQPDNGKPQCQFANLQSGCNEPTGPFVDGGGQVVCPLQRGPLTIFSKNGSV